MRLADYPIYYYTVHQVCQYLITYYPQCPEEQEYGKKDRGVNIERRKGVRRKDRKEELMSRNGENINCPSLSQEVIRNSIQETYTRIKCF